MIANMDNLRDLVGKVNLECCTHITTEYNLGGVRLYHQANQESPKEYLTETVPIDNAIAYLEGCLYNHYLN
jgi:hypothetical protein